MRNATSAENAPRNGRKKYEPNPTGCIATPLLNGLRRKRTFAPQYGHDRCGGLALNVEANKDTLCAHLGHFTIALA